MRNVGFIILAVLILSAFRLVLAEPAHAAGPWKAQVVSADTKQPLEGVVVLAWWTKHVRSFGGPSREYRDSEEVLTDRDGRFTIAQRSFFSFNPLVFFRGPFFAIFKPGYGEFRWPGYEGSETWPKEKQKALGTAAELFQLDGIVLEMSPLRSVLERREYLGKLPGDYLVVPLDRRRLLQQAIVEEQKALGYRGVIQP